MPGAPSSALAPSDSFQNGFELQKVRPKTIVFTPHRVDGPRSVPAMDPVSRARSVVRQDRERSATVREDGSWGV